MSTPPVVDDHGEPVDENLPERDDLYANPGLHEHLWRPTDVDPKAEKRAERQVATLFSLSALCTVLFIVCYFTVDSDDTIAGLGPEDEFSNSAVVADPALAPLTDIFAIPAGLPLANVFSVGDVLIAVGIVATIAIGMRRGAGSRTPG